MKREKSFIMYSEYNCFLKLLSDRKCGQLIKAIYEYTENETLPQLSTGPDMAFYIMKRDIDTNLATWKETSIQRAIAGAKGGSISKRTKSSGK